MSPAATVAPSESLTDTWAGRVEDYLRLRRSLGFALAWDEHLLRRFTAHLAQSGIAVLTVADAVAWAGALPAGQTHRPLTRASVRLTAIRGFATYLHSLDPVHESHPGMCSAVARPDRRLTCTRPRRSRRCSTTARI